MILAALDGGEAAVVFGCRCWLVVDVFVLGAWWFVTVCCCACVVSVLALAELIGAPVVLAVFGVGEGGEDTGFGEVRMSCVLLPWSVGS